MRRRKMYRGKLPWQKTAKEMRLAPAERTPEMQAAYDAVERERRANVWRLMQDMKEAQRK